jgi:hypothetical protein
VAEDGVAPRVTETSEAMSCARWRAGRGVLRESIRILRNDAPHGYEACEGAQGDGDPCRVENERPPQARMTQRAR